MKRTKNNPYAEHTKFPIKHCLVSTIVIIICGAIVLGMLYGIVNSTSVSSKAWIFAVVWASLLGASLIAFWIYQIIKYKKTRKDEN
jgi:biotin transporter BioY